MGKWGNVAPAIMNYVGQDHRLHCDEVISKAIVLPCRALKLTSNEARMNLHYPRESENVLPREDRSFTRDELRQHSLRNAEVCGRSIGDALLFFDVRTRAGSLALKVRIQRYCCAAVAAKYMLTFVT